MKTILSLFLASALATLIAFADPQQPKADAGKQDACDFKAFLAAAVEVERTRSERLLTEAEFAEAASKPGVIILDARGAEFYRQLHVKGAFNLPFTHFTDLALSELIPDKNTKVLIYCRNNLANARARIPSIAEVSSFPVTPGAPLKIGVDGEYIYPEEFEPPEFPKSASAGLNIPVFITLHSYGYTNVWELKSVVDPDDSPIEFEGEATRRAQ